MKNLNSFTDCSYTSKSKSKKDKFENIFVILTYKNTSDVTNCILSIKENVTTSLRIIIVNSYFNNETAKEFEDIADSNGCDFINVKNGGYGYGNNRGIEYALKNYDFEYLSIANPDIKLISYSTEGIESSKPYQICPKISTLSGKNQNPFWAISNPFSEWIIKTGYLINSRFVFYIGVGINRIIREFFIFFSRLFRFITCRVYAGHGSFVTFTRPVFNIVGLPYDENMFLYSEEMYLARLLWSKQIRTIMHFSTKVVHKTKSSTDFDKLNLFQENRKTFLYYYAKRSTLKRQG